VEFTTRYADVSEADSWSENFQALTSALELVLLEDSYELLRRRLKDKQNPVDLDQLAEIVLWLLDAYGLRPTQPSSDSSDGSPSPASGTPSTESTPPEDAISAPSLPIAS
jgi:hypothetical protein